MQKYFGATKKFNVMKRDIIKTIIIIIINSFELQKTFDFPRFNVDFIIKGGEKKRS